MPTPQVMFSAMKNFRRVVPLMCDMRVPLGLKAGTALMALLILSPLDIFGDIPVLGLLDDAVLLSLLAMLFVKIATRAVQVDVTPRNVTPERGAKPAGDSIQLPPARPIRKT